MRVRFFHCEICGKVIALLPDSDIPTICCGKPMQEMVPGQTDGAEKHVPVCLINGNTVQVRIGSLPHPMAEVHSILWVGLETLKGFQFKALRPGDFPQTCFTLCAGDEAKTVYAFCNIHGLWSAKASE